LSSDDLREFEIHIHRGGEGAATYPVSVRVSPDDLRADGDLVVPFTDDEIGGAIGSMEEGLLDEAAVRAFGGGLFGALFQEQLRSVYGISQVGPSASLRFRLVIDPPELMRIPWELLYDPERRVFLAAESPLVRAISAHTPTEVLAVPGPLHILVIDAFPGGFPRPSEEVEAAGIRDALTGPIKGRKVRVSAQSAVTLPWLQNALREAATSRKPFHVVHFIGHGGRHPETGRTVLVFEDGAGNPVLIGPEAMTPILGKNGVRLVFLNACGSARSSAATTAEGFAPTLLEAGIPAVIGMQTAVRYAAATQFSRNFYAAVADNQPVDVALRDARQLAHADKEGGTADLAVPVCYLRAPNGRIADFSPPRIPLTTRFLPPGLRENPVARTIAKAVQWVILVVLATLIGVAVTDWVRRSGPSAMTGDFNIAVASFGSLNSSGKPVPSSDARSLSQSMSDRLSTELAALSTEGFDVQVRGPAETGTLSGSTAAARAEAAQRLARTIGADLVVYGVLASDGTTLQPEFYLADGKLSGAEELSGQYEMGTPVVSDIDIAVNPAARKEMRDQLLSRTSAMARFVIGVSYFLIGDYTSAGDHFTLVAERGGWDDRDSKEILYLFQGTTAAHLNDLNGAESWYEQALEVNPEYARALVGLADIQFQRSKGQCAPGQVDAEGLAQARSQFEDALSAADQPAVSDIPIKVHFGVGRVYLCVSEALVEDDWSKAEAEFRQVVTAFDSGQTRVRDLAAEAHAYLALVYLPLVDDPNPRPSYRRAVGEYLKAIELSQHSDRKAFFWDQLGFVYQQLGDCAAAQDSYATAISLERDPQRRAQYEEHRAGLPSPCPSAATP
jgi:tetratricopeptide (TPR) repeat protein